MNPEEARREIKRLEDRRLRIAPEVMGGNREALEEDERLERSIVRLARTGRKGQANAGTEKGDGA